MKHLVKHAPGLMYPSATTIAGIYNFDGKNAELGYPVWCPGDQDGIARYDNAVHLIEYTDCPACIQAWETAPQPITTADLVPIVTMIRALALHRNEGVVHLAEAHLERLMRPRRKPAKPETPA